MPRPLVGQPPAHLIDALAEALRPLVRLSLAKGLTYPVVADLVRELFVAVGRHEFLEGDQAGMQSRLSVLTGIHRREIKRLAADTPEKSKATTSATRGGELVSRWTSTRPFIDAKGKPLPLPRLFSDGGRRSFEALVTSFMTVSV